MNETGEKGKLNTDQQIQVCQWLGEMKTPAECADLCKVEFGVELTRQAIDLGYRKAEKWAKVIKDAYEAWSKDLLAVPMANKKKRLEMLQGIIKDTKKSDQKHVAITAAAQIHKELEGTNINIKGKMTHSLMINEAIKKADEAENDPSDCG